MTEFSPEDFRDTIQDMCDDALRRMFAIQEGGLGVMQPGDEYVCNDFKRDDVLEVIEFSTSLRTVIAGDIHPEVLRTTPDYTLEILGGAVVALAKRAAYLGRGSTVLVPSYDAARSHALERMMLSQNEVDNGQPIGLFAQELGSLGLVKLGLECTDEEWQLNYHSLRRTALMRY